MLKRHALAAALLVASLGCGDELLVGYAGDAGEEGDSGSELDGAVDGGRPPDPWMSELVPLAESLEGLWVPSNPIFSGRLKLEPTPGTTSGKYEFQCLDCRFPSTKDAGASSGPGMPNTLNEGEYTLFYTSTPGTVRGLLYSSDSTFPIELYDTEGGVKEIFMELIPMTLTVTFTRQPARP